MSDSKKRRMKREDRNKENQVHICVICGKTNTENNMFYSKPRNRKKVWVCKECYKKECRGARK